MMTDREIRSNTIALFKIDGKTVVSRLLSMNATDEWMDKADAAVALETGIADAIKRGDVGAARKAKRERAAAMLDCVLDCVKSDERDFVRDNATSEQIIDAFFALKEKLDPFEQAQLAQFSAVMTRLNALPESVRESAIQKFLLSGSAPANLG